MARHLVWLLSLALLPAFAAQLAGVEVGVPAPGFDPADLKTYRIAEARDVFYSSDPAVLFKVRWKFGKEDVGPLPLELYLIRPDGGLEHAGYVLEVKPAWVGRAIPTYFYFRLTPAKVRAFPGTWTAYLLANGELKGTATIELRPARRP